MARRFFYVSLGVLALAIAGGSAEARTWHILPGGSGDAPSIQAGIDSAAVGDTVSLGCGTYFAVNVVMKPGIVLRSESGDPACATIDGQGVDRIFYCYMLTLETRIEGLTITGGYEPAYPQWPAGHGGGMFCQTAAPKIRDCVFRQNYANAGGAMFCWEDASPELTDCLFLENKAENTGGLLCAWSSSPRLRLCEFRGNQSLGGGSYGGAISFSENCSPVIEECAFLGNSADWYGGAIYGGNNTSALISGCTFSMNHVALPPGGGAIYTRAFAAMTLENCVLALNLGGGALACHLQSYQPMLTCCDVFGNADGDWLGCIADQYGVNGNFSADPLFCDPDAGDFTLRSDSPCLPGQHPGGYDCEVIGAFGEGCSAPTAVEHTSWGGVKAMFR